MMCVVLIISSGCLDLIRPDRLRLKDEYPISVADKDTLKPQLVPAMIALSGASDKAIRAQIAESVSLIAELDFPERWPDLIDVRQ